ncbi:MAG: uroporphyrinogen decarboxylase [Gemmatimonadetes bacterium]|nr:uroporphyrinogen decarboxylase [Gemmatimonadota bacterium]
MSDLFLRALAREPVERTPVWFMRQAGRCLPAYRAAREERGFFELVRDPEAAARVTALPLEYFPVDALVLFQDLSTPFEAAGLEVELRPGVGPVVLPPWEGLGDAARLVSFDPRDRLGYVLEAIRLLRARHEQPIIGFVGAPFTLCSYLTTGPRETRLAVLRAFMVEHPAAWDRLASFWVDHLAEFGIAQHEAGAGAIQVFDSWSGVLDPRLYETRVLPYSAALLDRLRAAGVPTVHFGSAYQDLLPLVAAAGGDGIGVDWRTPLDVAWEAIGVDRAIQGNLDPALVLAGEEAAVRGTLDVLERAGGRPGHIFNLGHGLHPDSDPKVIAAIVRAVRDAAQSEASCSASVSASRIRAEIPSRDR